MLELKRFYLQNYHLWRKAEFYFEPGISLVTGANRSGKTLLFRSVKQALRAQVEKRGTSLSKMPKKSVIGLDFKAGKDDWTSKLTPTLLSISKNGKDQGSTGKNAPREMLAKAIAIPSDLFDSTIHVTGTGSHPLIDGTPSTRLAWVSAVLDLTDDYDIAAKRVDKDLKAALAASAEIKVLEEELDEIEIPKKLPDVSFFKKALAACREDDEYFSAGVKLLDALDRVRVEHDPDTYVAQIKSVKTKLDDLKSELKIAQAYETERERADLADRLRGELQQITFFRNGPVNLDRLNKFCDSLDRFNRSLQELNDRWENSESDRKLFAGLKRLMREAPSNLGDVIEKARFQVKQASTQYRHLRHVEGTFCPVCSSKLTEKRRKELLDEAADLWKSSADKLDKLQKYIDAQNELSEVEPRVLDLLAPPTKIDLTPIVSKFFAEAKQLIKAKQIKGRLADLKVATGVELQKPLMSLEKLEASVDSQSERLVQLRIKHEHSLIAEDLKAKLIKKFGKKYNEDDIRKYARQAGEYTEELVAKIAQAEQLLSEVDRLKANRERLITKLEELDVAVRHLPELLELKEAMGRRGLRLVKIRELVNAFQAEMNSLFPLMWKDPFEIDIEVKENGLEIFASRNGVREDLLSLSGSEVKVFKLLTALALIRLLPARLRCNVLLLDELEANLDDETRRRFVTEYLPELLKSIECVVLISPLNYEDLPLKTAAKYQVSKEGSISTLKRVG